MADNLELGIFVAVLMAFVVCGCLVTRAPKKAPNTWPGEALNSAGEGLAAVRCLGEQF